MDAEEEKLTWANVMRGFEESRRRNEELDAKIAEVSARMREVDAKLEKILAYSKAEAERRSAEADVRIAIVNDGVYDIDDNDGSFSRESFLNALTSKKMFAGIYFDDVTGAKFGGAAKLPNGKWIHDKFDIVMLGDTDIAVIETSCSKFDVKKFAEERVKNFKIIFPYYKDYKIYLGLGDLAFEKDVVEEAKKYGIGLLKQVGNTVEYATDWEVKAY